MVGPPPRLDCFRVNGLGISSSLARATRVRRCLADLHTHEPGAGQSGVERRGAPHAAAAAASLIYAGKYHPSFPLPVHELILYPLPDTFSVCSVVREGAP